MNPREKTVTVLVAIVLVSGIILGLYALARMMGPLLADLFAAMGGGPLVGLGVLLLSAVIIARGLSQGGSRTGDLAVEKAAMYGQLLTLLSVEVDQDHTASGLRAVERQMALLARKSVLSRYSSFRELSKELDPDERSVREAMERLVFEIRRDLGHRDGLSPPEGLLDWAMARAGKDVGEFPLTNSEELLQVPGTEETMPPPAPEPREPRQGEFRIVSDSL